MSEAPTTRSQDLLAGGLAALLVFGAGLLVMLGWAVLGGTGAVLGGIAAAIGGFWWRAKHEAFFPRDLSGGGVGGIAALVAIIALCFVIAL